MDRYIRLIESKVGTLGDSTISRAEAISRLTAFVTMLYAVVGRRDFWALQTAYQVGAGIKCYSFHGLEGKLVNGPLWGPDGLLFNDPTQYIQVSTSLGTPLINHTGFTVFKQIDGGSQARPWVLEDGSAITRNPLLNYNVNNSGRIYMSPLYNTGGDLIVDITPDQNYHTLGYRSDGTNMELIRDGVSLITGVRPSGAVAGVIGSAAFWSPWDGVGSFSLLTNVKLTQSQFFQLETAYKLTIGQDLGLL